MHAKGLHAPRIRRETRYELFRFFIAIFHKEKKTNFYTHLYQKELKQGRLLHNTYLEPVSLNSNMLFTFNAVYPLHFIYSVFLDYFTYLQSLISNWHNWTPQLCITPQESFFLHFNCATVLYVQCSTWLSKIWGFYHMTKVWPLWLFLVNTPHPPIFGPSEATDVYSRLSNKCRSRVGLS